MSVYFDYKVHIEGSYQVATVEWHTQLPLLAVGLNLEESNNGTVNICDELVSMSFICDFWRNDRLSLYQVPIP